MELRQLSIFRAVVETRSFSAAAEIIHLTQPAVSMQVRLLEEELGCVLLHRGRRGAELTPEGTSVYRTAKLIAAEIDSLEIDIAAHRDVTKGHIGIACSDTFAAYVLTDLIDQFSNRYPGIDVSIYNGTSAEIESLLLDHHADIGFLSMGVLEERIEYSTFMTYRDTAAISPSHPLARLSRLELADLEGTTFLLLEKGTRAREFIDDALKTERVKPGHIMELGSVAVQLEFAAAGIGIAIVPGFAAQRHNKAGSLELLPLDGLAEREIGTATCRGSRRSAATNAFIGLCLPSV